MRTVRYAMTGATGFLGTELAEQLRDAGHEVVALVRSPGKAQHLTDLGVRLVPGDLDDSVALDRLLEGADGFFHVAGWFRHGAREHDTLRHVNIDGTRNALEAARRSGVARTVYTSTLAVNSDTRGAIVDESYRFSGQHATEYDRTKAVAHDIAVEYAAAGVPLVVVQPSVIYGPRDVGSTLGQLTRWIVAGKRVVAPRGGAASFVYVSDAARGHILAMEQGDIGESYFLAGPPSEFGAMLGLAARLAGTRPPILLPEPVVRLTARLTGPVEKVLPLPQFLTADAARAGLGTYYGDPAKARRELGWTARSLEKGMVETVAAIRSC